MTALGIGVRVWVGWWNPGGRNARGMIVGQAHGTMYLVRTMEGHDIAVDAAYLTPIDDSSEAVETVEEVAA